MSDNELRAVFWACVLIAWIATLVFMYKVCGGENKN